MALNVNCRDCTHCIFYRLKTMDDGSKMGYYFCSITGEDVYYFNNIDCLDYCDKYEK